VSDQLVVAMTKKQLRAYRELGYDHIASLEHKVVEAAIAYNEAKSALADNPAPTPYGVTHEAIGALAGAEAELREAVDNLLSARQAAQEEKQ
jgi:hypothetical protein